MQNERTLRESDGIMVTDEKGNHYLLFPVINFTPQSISYATLLALHIPQNISGFNYIISAVSKLKEKPGKYKNAIVKNLYTEIAEEHSTTTKAVERGMRYAISTCEKNEKYYEIFGDTSKLTTTKFLFTLANIT